MSKKEVIKKTFSDLISEDRVLKMANLDEFNQLINQSPPKNWLRVNKYANNSLYLPIDKTEYMLRKIYKNVDIEVKQVGVLFNAVHVSVRISYVHPVTGEKCFVDGVGAKQIQTKKGSSPADMSNINNNAVEMALPIAKTNAIKDASHMLGRIFGGDLNRKDIIEEKLDDVLQDKKFEIEKDRLLKAIENGYKPTKEEIEKYEIG